MTAYQSYKLSRLRAVLLFLETLPAISSRPSIQTRAAGLKTLVDTIVEIIMTQTQPLRGSIKLRDQALTQATDTTLAVGALVRGYAEKRKLPDLAAQVDIVRSDIAKIRRADRMLIAQRVHDAAASVVADLAAYEVTPELLARFQAQIDDADEAVDLPRATSDNKKTATVSLGARFREADEFIKNELTPLFLLMKENDPALFARYVAATQVLDRPATHGSANAESTAVATPATGATSTPATQAAAA